MANDLKIPLTAEAIPEDGPLTPAQNMMLCAGCVRCCTYVAVEVDAPDTPWQYDQYVWLLYHKTQIGAVVRAGVDDREMVNATGINVDRLFVLVSALASFLAGAAGVAGGAFLTLNPGAEWDILVLALVVVIIGGLGSLEGAILGSIIVGLLDAYGRWLFPELSYFILFGPMAILLLFRATGIFGKEH